jgi:hypothetical protein
MGTSKCLSSTRNHHTEVGYIENNTLNNLYLYGEDYFKKIKNRIETDIIMNNITILIINNRIIIEKDTIDENYEYNFNNKESIKTSKCDLNDYYNFKFSKQIEIYYNKELYEVKNVIKPIEVYSMNNITENYKKTKLDSVESNENDNIHSLNIDDLFCKSVNFNRCFPKSNEIIFENECKINLLDRIDEVNNEEESLTTNRKITINKLRGIRTNYNDNLNSSINDTEVKTKKFNNGLIEEKIYRVAHKPFIYEKKNLKNKSSDFNHKDKKNISRNTSNSIPIMLENSYISNKSKGKSFLLFYKLSLEYSIISKSLVNNNSIYFNRNKNKLETSNEDKKEIESLLKKISVISKGK